MRRLVMVVFGVTLLPVVVVVAAAPGARPAAAAPNAAISTPVMVSPVPTPVPNTVFSLSDDGMAAAFAYPDSNLPGMTSRFDLRTGELRGRVQGGVMSADGRFLATGDCRLDVSTNELLRTVQYPGPYPCISYRSAISPDGSIVATWPENRLENHGVALSLWRPGTPPVPFQAAPGPGKVVVAAWFDRTATQLTVVRTPSTCSCFDIARFDLATGVETSVGTGGKPIQTFRASSGGRFVAFTTNEPGDPAGSVIHALYRLDTLTGQVVHIDDNLDAFDVSETGRVAYVKAAPVVSDGLVVSGYRVALWDGGVTRFVDGHPDGSMPSYRGLRSPGPWAISGDGTVVAWVSTDPSMLPDGLAVGLLVARVDQAPVGQRLAPVVPERLLDTRNGLGVEGSLTAVGGVVYAGGKPRSGATVRLQVTGRGATAVPLGASAVVLNITATEAAADGYVTVWPCGQPQPTASSLNVRAGDTVPNLVVVGIGQGGGVCAFVQSSVHLIADVQGWYPFRSSLVPVVPERLLDTRPGSAVGYGGGKPGAGTTVEVQIAGAGATKVPADAAGVLLNVTGTEASADGYVTAWPCGAPRPTASNLNLVAAGTRPNLVAVALGDLGRVCLYTQSGAHLVADVAGWLRAGSSFAPVVPERLLDTRVGIGFAGPKPGPQSMTRLQVTGVGKTAVPVAAVAVTLNVTAIEASTGGYVTVWPCGAERPTASNLNLAARETAANLVTTKLGDGGAVCLYSQSGAHLVADIAGYER